ncbi:MAG: GNAT family N-acetyltransferase, partial [Actinobacteria bacterium]|nr:GNAT family N-acetyltransferase [Actinomycetota bacterium]
VWDTGVARALLDETMPFFDRWGVTHAGLFTFPQSPKHLSLYQRYGFLPRFLTAVLARPPAPLDVAESAAGDWATAADTPDLEQVIAWCARVTDETYPGLDVAREIRATASQKLGDTVITFGDGEIDGFAICHTGPGSEAGTGTCYLKFAAALPGPGAARRFNRLVIACEAFATRSGAETITAGVNTARRGAHQALLDRAYKAQMMGVTMHRPDEAAYHDPSAWVLDDWR